MMPRFVLAAVKRSRQKTVVVWALSLFFFLLACWENAAIPLPLYLIQTKIKSQLYRHHLISNQTKVINRVNGKLKGNFDRQFDKIRPNWLMHF
jgi:hypothetical protein